MRIANSDLMTRKQCYTVFVVLLRADEMKNVTVTLDDRVADWARVWAAQHRTSVSRMLGNLLAEKMAQDERYAAAKRAQCTMLLSEDLQDGLDIDGMRIVNPFGKDRLPE